PRRSTHRVPSRPRPTLVPYTTLFRSTSERTQNGFGDSARVAALEPRVVVDADPGEERDFLAAESGNAPVVTVGAEARLLRRDPRSEEHTSELQSPDHLVCRLLLEKKE